MRILTVSRPCATNYILTTKCLIISKAELATTRYNTVISGLIRNTKVKIYILILTFPVQAHKNITWLLAQVKQDRVQDECNT